MKHIVLVTDITFWEPSYGSHSRIRQLIRQLAGRYRVSIFFLRSLSSSAMAEWQAMGLARDVKLISYKDYSGINIKFRKDLSKHPYFEGRKAEDFASSLAGFLRDDPADVAIFEYLKLAYLKDACGAHVTTILDMHDVMSSRTVNLRLAGLKASIEIESATERHILSQFDRLLAISKADVTYLETQFGFRNVIYAPYSIKAMHRTTFGSGKRLIFIGANSAPNISGLRWFLDQVWPMLSPGYELHVIGDVWASFKGWESAQREGKVFWHGRQADMDPHIAMADIAINPVFVGGGLKIKCVDALANGLPCVTTREGAAGLEDACHSGLLVAHTRAQFAMLIERLAASEKHRKTSAEASWNFMNSTFSTQAAHRDLLSFLDGDRPTVGASVPA